MVDFVTYNAVVYAFDGDFVFFDGILCAKVISLLVVENHKQASDA